MQRSRVERGDLPVSWNPDEKERVPQPEPSCRLLPGNGLANGACTIPIALHSIAGWYATDEFPPASNRFECSAPTQEAAAEPGMLQTCGERAGLSERRGTQ